MLSSNIERSPEKLFTQGRYALAFPASSMLSSPDLCTSLSDRSEYMTLHMS
ncbi:MAG: hypothetical protein HC873_18345 [Leptolyngbyaceae cyanobacterium SL_1_1]|nr:hypothetical protein [Leptolyngbyaceae cyanobacterium SL_1_1]